jgi:hypothetical protein
MKIPAVFASLLLLGVLLSTARVAAAQGAATVGNTPPAASISPLDYWDKVSGIVAKTVQTVALLVGGAFAYFKFVRGRVFRPRLELSVSGTLFEKNGSRYLIATAKAKNVGLSKCATQQEGSGVRISAYTDDGWEVLTADDVLQQHEWIESAEPLSDDVLFPLNHRHDVAYRLEFRLVSQDKDWLRKREEWFPRRRRHEWSTQAILGAGAMNDETAAKRKSIMDLIHAAIGG